MIDVAQAAIVAQHRAGPIRTGQHQGLRLRMGGAQARGVALLVRGNPGTWPAIVWRKAL